MKHGIWVLALGLACGACGESGIQVGSEEPCETDPLLTEALERGAMQELPTCARLGESRLVDGSFEVPAIADCNSTTFCQFTATQVPGWDTTSAQQKIELWNDKYNGVPADDGKQFGELDAASQDTLFQDLALTPGQIMYWSFSHRGRNGRESVELLLGPPDSPASQGVFESPSDAWSTYSGFYVVGGKEEFTRFALASRSGTSSGNLVDAILFSPVN